ncbi:MAG: mechanosensitive ion channel family protein [Planctomycetes bacterium]|nr:mechanosensitive ion channel family protein [Planctomycetota bacterium]
MNQDLILKIQEWLIQKGADFAIDLLVFFLILLIGKFVISGICSVTRKMLENSKRVSEILCTFTVNIVNKILWIVLIMLALPRLGVDIGPLIAGLGVGGFIIGFAFQETLGNLASGLMLLLNQPFNKGDYVEAGGVAGVVQDLNIMATTLTSPDNKKIVVPNKAIWGSSITNYSALETRRVDLGMGISYSADINQAKQVALDVIAKEELILEDPAPMVEVVEMADSSVNFVVRPWCKTADYWTVYFNINHALKEALDSAGIEIPFPQMDIHYPKE